MFDTQFFAFAQQHVSSISFYLPLPSSNFLKSPQTQKFKPQKLKNSSTQNLKNSKTQNLYNSVSTAPRIKTNTAKASHSPWLPIAGMAR